MCLARSGDQAEDQGAGHGRLRLDQIPGPHMAYSDEALLALIASGDRSAFAAFYERHAPRIMGLLARMLPRRAEAEDALQETFWQVWARAGDYNPGRASPIVWLVMMARSRAMDLLRKRRRETTGLSPEHEPGVVEDDPIELRDNQYKTRNALGRLAEEQRSLISLAFYGGMTHEQIAVLKKMPLGTVKTRIRTGIRRMRELLGAESKAVAS